MFNQVIILFQLKENYCHILSLLFNLEESYLLSQGKNIKTYIGSIIPDNALDWIEGNKMMFGMGCYLIGNILNNNINNAGAFEIYCNEELIWSAINNNKKVPNLEGIIMMINKYGGKLLKR